MEIVHRRKTRIVAPLTHLCLGIIVQQLQRDNVLQLFDYLRRYGLLDTAGNLFGQIIRMETSIFIDKEKFDQLHPRVLSWLLYQRTLNVKSELDLFDACIRWAQTKCDKSKIEKSPENLRKSLGQLFFLLHIPSLNKNEMNEVLKSGLFSQQEGQILLEYKQQLQQQQQLTDGKTIITKPNAFLLQFINGFVHRKRPSTIVYDLPYCPLMNQGNCYVRPQCQFLSNDFRKIDPMRPQIVISLWVSRFTYLVQVCFRVRLEYERFEIEVLNDSTGKVYYEQTVTTKVKDNLINVSFQEPILFPPHSRLLISARAVMQEPLYAEPDSMRSTFFSNHGNDSELQIRYKADIFYPARFNVQFFKLF